MLTCQSLDIVHTIENLAYNFICNRQCFLGERNPLTEPVSRGPGIQEEIGYCSESHPIFHGTRIIP